MNETALKTELTCPVCLDVFEDPLILPCVHSYCKKCLEHLLDNNTSGGRQAGLIYTTFKCPQCKQMIHLDERRLDSLPKNFLLANIVAAFHRTTPQEPTNKEKPKKGQVDKIDCSVCEKQVPVGTVKVCLQCSHNRYCKTCFKQYHPSRGVFKRHVILSVSDAAVFKGNSEFCNLHLFPCVVHCKTCDKAVCPSCCAIGAHKAHVVDFYEKDGKPQEITFFKSGIRAVYDKLRPLESTTSCVPIPAYNFSDPSAPKEYQCITARITERTVFLRRPSLYNEDIKRANGGTTESTCWYTCQGQPFEQLFQQLKRSRFIQISQDNIQGPFKDFSRPSDHFQGYETSSHLKLNISNLQPFLTSPVDGPGKATGSSSGEISVTPDSSHLNRARTFHRQTPTLRNVPTQRPSSAQTERIENVLETFNQRIQELDAELGWGSGLTQPVSNDVTTVTPRRLPHTDVDEIEFPVIIPSLRTSTRPFTPSSPVQNDDSWLLPCDEGNPRHRNTTPLRAERLLNLNQPISSRPRMDNLDDALNRFMSSQRFRRNSRR